MPTDDRPLVVLAGPIHADADALLAKETEVIVADDLSEAGVVGLAHEAQGILFRSRPHCSASLMAACPRLRVVGRHGAGLDIVDILAATRLGVAVVHAPGANAPAVAEHALMLMLMCAKRAVQVDRWTRDGDWRARKDALNEELGGKTLGIVGVGNIGRRVAALARAFGMQVLAYDKYLNDDVVRRRGAEPVPSLEALLPQVDVLTCHTPLTAETRAMIGARTLALMKRGAILVNTSRGAVHDERAVFEAVATGQLGAAGLDVFEEEPTPVDNPLFGLPNVVCSQHVAGVTAQANRAVGMQVASEMLRVLRGERPEVLVNPEVWESSSARSRRHGR
jgi:D-3-phosphoglycerate dehydrogenase / 2-oxoglutarate reductase